jgi:hypothetical protein
VDDVWGSVGPLLANEALSGRDRLGLLLLAEEAAVGAPSTTGACADAVVARLAADAYGRTSSGALPACETDEVLPELPEGAMHVLASRTGAAAIPVDGARALQRRLQARGEILVRYLVVADPGQAGRLGALRVDGGRVAWFDLGPVGEIDTRAAAFREVLSAFDPDGNPRYDVASWRDGAAALRSAVWDPVVAADEDRRVVLVTDGSLQAIPFDALPGRESGFLVEQATIRYAPAAATWAIPAAPRGAGLLVVSSPDPARASPDASSGSIPPEALPDPSALRVPESLGAAVSVRLSRAADQAGAIARGDGDATSLSGGTASEAALRALAPGSAWVHLAAWSYVLDPPDGEPLTGLSGFGPLPLAIQRPPPATGLAAGLVLAGFLDAAPLSPTDDGLVTAAEVRTLDLAGLGVTLVGADSGVAAGRASALTELRGAFFAAGASDLLTSLWPSPSLDLAPFYAAVAGGAEPASALRETMLAQIQILSTTGEAHPGEWASYVLIGEGEEASVGPGAGSSASP